MMVAVPTEPLSKGLLRQHYVACAERANNECKRSKYIGFSETLPDPLVGKREWLGEYWPLSEQLLAAYYMASQRAAGYGTHDPMEWSPDPQVPVGQFKCKPGGEPGVVVLYGNAPNRPPRGIE